MDKVKKMLGVAIYGICQAWSYLEISSAHTNKPCRMNLTAYILGVVKFVYREFPNSAIFGFPYIALIEDLHW